MSTTIPKLPSRPKLPARPALGKRFELPAFPLPEAKPRDTDEYGLGTWAAEIGPTARGYLARAYSYLKLDKAITPTAQSSPIAEVNAGAGTVPELVFFGGLLARNFTSNGYGSRTFQFQSYQLGGRKVPGGAVVDFVLYLGGRVIGVRVDSVFHGLSDPFGRGASEVEEAASQRRRLLASSGLDTVVDVNKSDYGYPMEPGGPDGLVDVDIDEALRA
jgi:hypothetical protein